MCNILKEESFTVLCKIWIKEYADLHSLQNEESVQCVNTIIQNIYCNFSSTWMLAEMQTPCIHNV